MYEPRIIIDKEEAIQLVGGSSFKSYLDNITYKDLIHILGEPVMDLSKWPRTLGTDTFFEWVIEFDGRVYVIYDWKTFDLNYTKRYLRHWHVGSHDYPIKEFYEWFEMRLKELRID